MKMKQILCVGLLVAVIAVQENRACVKTLSALSLATFENGANVYSVAWQVIGSSYYVAMGGNNLASGPEVRVLQFNPNTQILSELPTATFDNGTGVLSIAWQAIGSSYYVAMGSANFAGPEVRVLQFDPNAQTLVALPAATFENGVSVQSVAWQETGTNYYVAVGSDVLVSGPEVRVLQFDPNAQTLTALLSATFENAVAVNSVAWQAIGSSYYVVMGGNDLASGPEVRVLQFDPNAQILSALPTATFDNGSSVSSVAWQAIGLSYYVAVVGIPLASGPEVRVLQFDPNAQTLISLSTATFESGSFVNSVAWQTIGSSYYVAMGGSIPAPQMRVLQFDPNAQTLSALSSATLENGSSSVRSVAWQAVGSSYYIAMGGDNLAFGPEVRVLQFECVPVPTPTPTPSDEPTPPASPFAIALVHKYHSRLVAATT